MKDINKFKEEVNTAFKKAVKIIFESLKSDFSDAI